MANALEDIRNSIWLLKHNEINIGQYEELIKKWCDAEPIRHGHWEDCSNGWMCYECHRDSSRDTKYCPHCGAKMDGEFNE